MPLRSADSPQYLPALLAPDQRTAIVTGAASGIGRALADRLVGLGFRVALTDVDQPRLDRVVDELGPAATAIVADAADSDAWSRVVGRLRDEWPRLDLLVNNAGVLAGGELCGSSAADLRRVLDVNLTGTLLGCHAAGPWLIDSAPRSGVKPAPGQPLPGIVSVASIFATLAPPGFAAYSASKAGVVALSESLRGELAPHGLNVTVALPGTTPTALFDSAAYAHPKFRDVIAGHQQRSELTPDAVARAVLNAAAQGRPHVVIGGRARRLALLKRLSPAATLRRVAAQARRELGLPHRQPAADD